MKTNEYKNIICSFIFAGAVVGGVYVFLKQLKTLTKKCVNWVKRKIRLLEPFARSVLRPTTLFIKQLVTTSVGKVFEKPLT